MDDRPTVDPGAAASLARLLHRVGRLKWTPRTGWLDRGVSLAEAESVADHSFRVALLAWLAARLARAAGAPLDPDRVLCLALLHDLPESITGDLPPYDQALVPTTDPVARRRFLDRRHHRHPARAAAKRAAEKAAMADLVAELAPPLATDLDHLWRDLEAGASAEARFVKQADKLETFLQSREYLTTDPDRPMASFAAEVADVIEEPTLRALLIAIAGLEIEAPQRG